MRDPTLDDLTLHVAGVLPGVQTLGPGLRIGLWLEGCSLRCRGCMSPELFERRPSSSRSVGSVLVEIVALAPGHAGLTVSGGEPFEQPEPLAALLDRLHAQTALDFLVYSGHARKELEEGTSAQRRLLATVDMLMDGRFEEERPTTKIWRGSANQELHLLTPRAELHRAWLGNPPSGSTALQVGFDDAGHLRIVGIPERGFQRKLQRALAGRGVRLVRRGVA